MASASYITKVSPSRDWILACYSNMETSKTKTIKSRSELESQEIKLRFKIIILHLKLSRELRKTLA